MYSDAFYRRNDLLDFADEEEAVQFFDQCKNYYDGFYENDE